MLSYWLPLNGNLNNNGLSSLSPIPSATLIYNDNGKIGKCFNSGSQYISLPLETVPTDLSVCFWIKPNSPSAWSNIFSLGVNDNRMEVSTTTQYYWFCDSSSTPLIGSGTALFNLDNAVWNHICMTADGTTVKFYINGSLVNTVSQTNSFSTVFGSQLKINIGSRIAGNHMYKGYINDFRVYTDHCLSPLEVKQISQGLVCHYKLSGVGGENLVQNSTNKGDRYGYYILSNALSEPLVQGQVYTITINANLSSDRQWIGVWSDGGNTNLCDTQARNDTGIYKWTVTCNSHNAGKARFSIFCSNNPVGQMQGGTPITGTCDVEWVKLEKGSKATPWCPNPSDTLYSTLGYNDVTEYDSSGYGNNGTKVGTIAWSGDSARYSGSYYFDSKSHYKIPCPLVSPQEFSCSFWIKPISCGGYAIVSSNYNNPSSGFWLAVNCEGSSLWFYYNGSYARSNKGLLSLNTWYHVCFVFNKGIITWYQNGEVAGTTDLSSKIKTLGIKDYISIGNSYTGTIWNTNYSGNISDFRIYSTSLSAEDVKSLYNVSASIDKSGVLFCGEVIEN